MLRATLLILAAVSALAVEPAVIHVDPRGDDAWQGGTAACRAPDGPLRTLHAARERARRLTAEQRAAGVVVRLAAGAWHERLELGREDGGTAAAPVRWEGAGAARTRLSGALPLRDWIAGDGHVRRHPIPPTLASAFARAPASLQLVAGGRLQPLARWPNRDDGDAHGGTWAHAAKPASATEQRVLSLRQRDVAALRPWRDPRHARVAVFSGFDWAFRILPVAARDDAARTISLAEPTWCPLRTGDRWFVMGPLEELDAPGEWGVDPLGSEVRWWPPASAGATVEAALAQPGPALRIANAAHLSVVGMSIEGGGAEGVLVEGGTSVVIADCAVRACGGAGIAVQGGERCVVERCLVEGTGEGGIRAQGGDARTLAAGGHEIRDCEVRACAVVWRTYKPGIALLGVGNAALGNHVHHLPHAGVTFDGSLHRVERNHVHHVNRESSDTGGLYFCSRDWTKRGSVVRWNLFHHSGGYGKANPWKPVQDGRTRFISPGFTWGIYLDDPSSGTDVIGNVLDRMPVCALHNHGGRDNRWQGNIAIDCVLINLGTLQADWVEWPAIRKRLADAAPAALARWPGLARTPEPSNEVAGVQVVGNILVQTRAGTEAARRRKPEWADGIPVYTVGLRRDDLAKNRFDGNWLLLEDGLEPRVQLALDGKPQGLVPWSAWTALGFDGGSRLADPGFVDLARRDLRLRPDAPALAAGFEPIPFDRIGPAGTVLDLAAALADEPGDEPREWLVEVE